MEVKYIHFPEDALLDSVDAMLWQIQRAVPDTHRRRLSFHCVSVTKVSRYDDRDGRATTPGVFTYYSMTFIQRYMDFEFDRYLFV